MHEHAGRVAAGRGASVVARVCWQGAGDQQPRGARLLLGDYADAATLRVVDDVRPAVPVDKGGRVRRLQHDARQVDVAACLDEQLGVAEDLGFGYYK